jgi:anti-sigma factor RsiW
MPSCALIEPLITPFVDGQLPPVDVQAVQTHIQLCATCRSRVVAERAVSELLRTRRHDLCGEHAPSTLRARCRSQCDAARGTPLASSARLAWWRPRRLSPLTMAAGFVLVVAGAATFRATVGSTPVIAAELTADHVKCFMMNAVLGTHETSDAVHSEMESGFGWDARLPEHPERADLELVGSRPCLYERGKIAHIMYRHHGVPVSVYMLPGTERADEFRKIFGHEAAIWSEGHRTFVLIARAPHAEVERMVTFVQASLR